jgi:hypothetical protein
LDRKDRIDVCILKKFSPSGVQGYRFTRGQLDDHFDLINDGNFLICIPGKLEPWATLLISAVEVIDRHLDFVISKNGLKPLTPHPSTSLVAVRIVKNQRLPKIESDALITGSVIRIHDEGNGKDPK